MEQHGIRFRVRSAQQSQGRGAGAPTLTSAATIYARRQGIRVHRANGATNDATTITNSGAIFSGVGNAADTNTYRHRPHGILAFVPGTTMTGSLTVTNSGDITLGGPYTGIMMQYWASGAMSLDNSGNIGAVAGQTARQGIRFDFEYWENQSAQAVTLTNSGDITASEYGIRLKKLSGGAVTLTNNGAVTATAEAAQHLGHAIYLAEGVTFGEGRTYAANSGAITVDNSGALSSKNHAPLRLSGHGGTMTSSSRTPAPSRRRTGTASASSGPSRARSRSRTAAAPRGGTTASTSARRSGSTSTSPGGRLRGARASTSRSRARARTATRAARTAAGITSP